MTLILLNEIINKNSSFSLIRLKLINEKEQENYVIEELK
jgi:hypothetical protein